MRKRTSVLGRIQFSFEKANSVRYGIPSSRAASTTARTESLPRRWPSERASPRLVAHRPLPSITIATWRGNRAGSSERSGNSSSGSEVSTSCCKRRAPGFTGLSPGRRDSNLHNLRLFGGEHFVELLDELDSELLNLGLRSAEIVLGQLFFLVQILEHVVGVAPMVPDRYAEILGRLAHVTDQVLAPFLGQLRNRKPDHLAVVDGTESQVGALDRLFNFVSRAFVIRRDHQQARFGCGQSGQLPKRRFGAVVVDVQSLDQRGRRPSGPNP